MFSTPVGDPENYGYFCQQLKNCVIREKRLNSSQSSYCTFQLKVLVLFPYKFQVVTFSNFCVFSSFFLLLSFFSPSAFKWQFGYCFSFFYQDSDPLEVSWPRNHWKFSDLLNFEFLVAVLSVRISGILFGRLRTLF